MAYSAAQGWAEGEIQSPLEIPGDAFAFPVAIAGGRELARLILERIDRFRLWRWLIRPVRRLLEIFGGIGFLFCHRAIEMRKLALGFQPG